MSATHCALPSVHCALRYVHCALYIQGLEGRSLTSFFLLEFSVHVSRGNEWVKRKRRNLFALYRSVCTGLTKSRLPRGGGMLLAQRLPEPRALSRRLFTSGTSSGSVGPQPPLPPRRRKPLRFAPASGVIRLGEGRTEFIRRLGDCRSPPLGSGRKR